MKRLVILLSAFAALSCGNAGSSDKTTERDFSKLNDNEQAAEMQRINESIRKDINNADLYFERCQLEMAMKDYHSAMADIDRCLSINPNSGQFYEAKGSIFLRTGDYNNAEETWIHAAQIDPENTSVRIKLAELLFYRQRNEDAMQFLNQTLKIDVRNSDAYFLKAMILLNSTDTVSAIKNLQMAVDFNTEFFEAYFQLGVIHAFKKDKLSIDYYDNAIRIKPENVDVRYNKGYICQELGEFNLALKTYSDLLKIDPNYKNAHFNMGYINMFYLKQYKQGAVHFTDALKVAPDFYQAYYNRGYCYELLGDVLRAKIDYENALKIKPDYTTAAQGMERVTNF